MENVLSQTWKSWQAELACQGVGKAVSMGQHTFLVVALQPVTTSWVSGTVGSHTGAATWISHDKRTEHHGQEMPHCCHLQIPRANKHQVSSLVTSVQAFAIDCTDSIPANTYTGTSLFSLKPSPTLYLPSTNPVQRALNLCSPQNSCASEKQKQKQKNYQSQNACVLPELVQARASELEGLKKEVLALSFMMTTPWSWRIFIFSHQRTATSYPASDSLAHWWPSQLCGLDGTGCG